MLKTDLFEEANVTDALLHRMPGNQSDAIGNYPFLVSRVEPFCHPRTHLNSWDYCFAHGN